MTPEELIEENTPWAVEQAQRSALFFGLDSNEAISSGLWALRKAAEHFDPDGAASFSTYARKCIHNALLDQLKKEKRVADHFVNVEALGHDGFEKFLEAKPGNEISPSTGSAMQESDRILRASVDQLKESDRQMIELVWQGKKASEIAQVLGCTKQNVSYHLSRIYAELRSLLLKKGFGGLDTIGLLKTLTKAKKVTESL